MTRKEKYREFRLKIDNAIFRINSLPWLHIITIILCSLISFVIFYILDEHCYKTIDTTSTLTNLLTVNAVFSAILITYLFSRITWSRERKSDVYKEATLLSQKITEFRRILDKLTFKFGVWESDQSTKRLIDFGKYSNIDFYEYKLYFTSNSEIKNKELIHEFAYNEDFNEGISTVFLAMVSLVKNRKQPYHQRQEELYKNFELEGLYNIKVVERWIQCDIFGTIWYWLAKPVNYICYSALESDKNYILAAAKRIDKEYEDHELNNKLIRELAEDFSTYYLIELHNRLKELKEGVTELNLLLIVLISVSMIFGVLAPFTLLMIYSKTFFYVIAVSILASLNAGLISYFVLRFPLLIKKELKWI